MSADEPARKMESYSGASHVFMRLIKEAKTAALANTVMQQNIGLITEVDSAAGNTNFSRRVERTVEDRMAAEKPNNGAGGGTGDGKLL